MNATKLSKAVITSSGCVLIAYLCSYFLLIRNMADPVHFYSASYLYAMPQSKLREYPSDPSAFEVRIYKPVIVFDIKYFPERWVYLRVNKDPEPDWVRELREYYKNPHMDQARLREFVLLTHFGDGNKHRWYSIHYERSKERE